MLVLLGGLRQVVWLSLGDAQVCQCTVSKFL